MTGQIDVRDVVIPEYTPEEDTEIDTDDIGEDAPKFFRQTEDRYLSKYGEVVYGMITYDIEREKSQKYYCLYDNEIKSASLISGKYLSESSFASFVLPYSSVTKSLSKIASKSSKRVPV